jgi:hypothetical protein
MARPPFNADAKSRVELLQSRSPEFLDMEERAFKSGDVATTPEERKLLREYTLVDRRFPDIAAEREYRDETLW